MKFEVNFEVHTLRKLHFCERPEASIHLANVSRSQQRINKMDGQEDPLVQENPPEAPLVQPIVPPTQMMMYNQLPTPPPISLKGNLAENWTFFRESWESYKIATELDKKPKPVILKTLKIVLGRETYQIAKNLPIADCTDPDSFLQA